VSPRRGIRTPNLLFVREALSAVELPAGVICDEKDAPARFERAHGGFEAHCSVSTELRGGSGGSRARTCERSPVYALATRCLADSAMPPGKCARPGVFLAGTRGALGTGALSGRRGSRTPKGLRPTRFRDGVPRRWQSFRIGGDTGSDVRFTVQLLSVHGKSEEWLQQGSNLHVPG
jgi:hypothetical protein